MTTSPSWIPPPNQSPDVILKKCAAYVIGRSTDILGFMMWQGSARCQLVAGQRVAPARFWLTLAIASAAHATTRCTFKGQDCAIVRRLRG
jgi:hypothetical protein